MANEPWLNIVIRLLLNVFVNIETWKRNNLTILNYIIFDFPMNMPIWDIGYGVGLQTKCPVLVLFRQESQLGDCGSIILSQLNLPHNIIGVGKIGSIMNI